MRSSVSALLLMGCICLIQGLHIVFDKPQNTSGNSRIAKSPKEASNVRLYDERTVRHSSDYSRIELLRLCKGRNEVFSTCHPSCNVTCKNYRSCIPQSSLCLIRNYNRPMRVLICQRGCRRGCDCARGYARETADGPCIPVENCIDTPDKCANGLELPNCNPPTK